MIGNVNQVNREGPWPECLGMESPLCAELIQQYAKTVSSIEVVEEGSRCEGFQPSRVCIYVNPEGDVTKIPHKG